MEKVFLGVRNIAGERMRLMVMLLSCVTVGASAAQVDIVGPTGSGEFGASVTVLPNGNFAVTDPGYDLPGTNDVGAVYLFDGTTLKLISRLTGNTANDRVGSDGITVLTNSNWIARSPQWSSARGAVTWFDGQTRVTGEVSSSNSLIGSTTGDQVRNVTILPNGNYLVTSPYWDNGSAVDAGAVTWCSWETGKVGVITSANSLVGSKSGDQVGEYGATLLPNGNYVVISPYWDNGSAVDAGAVTWCNGETGRDGAITSANSLVGGKADDYVGEFGVTVLPNGMGLLRNDGQRS